MSVQGLRVPDDLSVTGFDDIPLAAYSVPALTTVRMPVSEMVAHGVAMVIDDQEQRAGLPDHPILEPALVVRDSTAAPRPGKIARTKAIPRQDG